MKRVFSRDELIALMKKQQGERSSKEFAAELGVSGSFLCDIYKGKRDPGPQILKSLGLTRKLMFERTA